MTVRNTSTLHPLATLYPEPNSHVDLTKKYMDTGFVEEMRFVAMKLHTKDQAPKEGGKEAAPQPFQKVLTSSWQRTGSASLHRLRLSCVC